MRKLSFKKLLCAAAVATTCASANAAVDLGTLTIGEAKTFFGYFPPGGVVPFGDIFDFILPANGGSSYQVVEFDLPIPGADYKVLFSAMSLYDTGIDNVRGGGNDVAVAGGVAGLAGNTATSITFSFGPTTTSKSMYLLVSGLADGADGGIYSGAISVSPVPEPETWAMMLVGAGLVGFRLRSRSKKSAATRLV